MIGRDGERGFWDSDNVPLLDLGASKIDVWFVKIYQAVYTCVGDSSVCLLLQ